MSASSVPSPATRAAAPSQQATLDALVALAVERFGEQLPGMAARFAAALVDVREPGLDAKQVYRRVKSGKLLKENSYAFTHLAATGIEQALRREIAGLRPQAAPVRVDLDALGLVPLEEIDSKLAFAALARPFDIAHSEPLALLSVRFGMLLGRGPLRGDSNPFRPGLFLRALDAAWREFEPDSDAHGLVQGLLKPGMLFDFGPLYEALGAFLARKDARPGSADGLRIQKTDDSAAARAARAASRAALAEQLRKLFGDDGGHDGVPLIPDLPGLPGGNGGWRPSMAAGFATPAPAVAGQCESGAPPAAGFTPGPAAIGMAQAAPGFTPAQAGVDQAAPGFAPARPGMALPAAGFAAGADGAQGGLQAVLAGLRPGVAAPLLDLLARIEPAAVAGAAAAAEDGAAAEASPGAGAPNVFFLPRLKQSLPQGSLSRRDEHTLDLLSRVFETVLLDDAIPPQTRELLQLLQVPVLKAALVDRNFFFEQAHPARRLVDLLSRMGWEQRQDADDPMFVAMKRSVERVRGDADGARPEGFAAAVAELEASLAQEESALERAIAEPVASAIRQEQLAVATRAAREAVQLRVQAGGVAEVVGGFLEQRWTTVLTFAYSIEERKPGAVGNATRAMDDLIWSVKPKPTQEQRKALIARLPRLLATLNKWLDAIRWQDAERLQFFARLAEYHAAIVRAPIELAPQRQFELAVEAAQQDALRRVELEHAAAQQQAEQQQALSPLDGLERGMWVEFSSADGARKVKLAWVSPLRTLFIFSGAGRREAFSLQAEKLAEALRAGSARVLAIDGVVGQVLSEAMGQGAVNDASMLAAASRAAAG